MAKDKQFTTEILVNLLKIQDISRYFKKIQDIQDIAQVFVWQICSTAILAIVILENN